MTRLHVEIPDQANPPARASVFKTLPTEAAKAEKAAAAVPLAAVFLRCGKAAVLSGVCKSFRNDSTITNRFNEKAREKEKANDKAEYLHQQVIIAELRVGRILTGEQTQAQLKAGRMNKALRTACTQLRAVQICAGYTELQSSMLQRMRARPLSVDPGRWGTPG